MVFVEVVLPLFRQAADELGSDEVTEPGVLQRLAGNLQQRLTHTATVWQQLEAAGWSAELVLDALHCSHPDISSHGEAEDRLRTLGLDPTDVALVETEVEDEPD